MKKQFLTVGFLLMLSLNLFGGIFDIFKKEKNEINLYTDRHYDTDQKLFDEFTKETGIKVNVVKAKSDELIERLIREGNDTKADLLITADAGRLYRAKEKQLLKPVNSKILDKNITSNLRDKDRFWYGLTIRGRVIVYAKDRVELSDLSTYEDLITDKWKNKILVRSSGNIYNQSLLASFISIYGKDKAEEWAKGIVKNLARTPKGNDRDQAKAVVSGVGDIAIMNTYYIGKMLNSSNPEEVKVANQIGVFFPNGNTTGTHINVSGIGQIKSSKNKNAIKLMEFLTSNKAQSIFANANYEYPANLNVEASSLLKSWGKLNPQNIELSELGFHNNNAVKIFDKVGWK